MKIVFIGAGRLARTLAAAFYRAGFDIAAVASRSPASAEALAQDAGKCVVCTSAQAAIDLGDLVFITVPDNAIRRVASGLRWRADQGVVHCSGATEVSALEAAAAQDARIGGFHPVQLFADPKLALRRIHGSSVAIEADGYLEKNLRQLAVAIGYRVIALPPGVRSRYHAATNFSASFLLSLLREACDLWNGFGVTDKDALAALIPLARGTLDAAAEKGLAEAMAGPISRGDFEVVALHLRELANFQPSSVDLYCSIAARQLRLAKEIGRLDPGTITRIAALVER